MFIFASKASLKATNILIRKKEIHKFINQIVHDFWETVLVAIVVIIKLWLVVEHDVNNVVVFLFKKIMYE